MDGEKRTGQERSLQLDQAQPASRREEQSISCQKPRQERYKSTNSLINTLTEQKHAVSIERSNLIDIYERQKLQFLTFRIRSAYV